MELFHFDIECRGNYKTLEDFRNSDLRGYNLFIDKYNKTIWKEKYENAEDAYKENSSILSTYGSICCISFGFIDNNNNKQVRSYYGEDERYIVESFNNLLKKVETKNYKLSGYKILTFDIPWILHKLCKYGIEPANIINLYGKKPWELRIADMFEDWKLKFQYSYSFDEMLYEIGIESPKKLMDGSEVNDYFWKGDLESIKTYCEKDVKSSIEASLKLYRNF